MSLAVWNLTLTVDVLGISSDYVVDRDRAIRLLDSGKACQVSRDTIRMNGSRTKSQRREWVKKQSGDTTIPVMQLVDVRKVRPRNKPKYLNN